MASKENQEALNYICSYCSDHNDCDSEKGKGCRVRNTLQQAIDDLETYKKALYLAIIDYCTLFGAPPKKILKKEIDNETKFYMERAKEELENENHN